MSKTPQLKGRIAGIVIGLAGLLFSLAPVGADLEESLGLYWLFHLRGAIPAPAEVVVVAIDQHSADKLGVPVKPSEWPRQLHGRLLDWLTREGAAVIAFDLTFAAPSRIAEQDSEFAAAIRKAGNVLLVQSLQREITDSVWTEKPVPPISPLAEAALAHAPFALPKAVRVNAYWTFRASAGDMPTLPVVALQLYAMPAYEEFLGLARKAAPGTPLLADSLPPSSPEAVQALLSTLRDTFMNDPRIGERMAKELEGESGRALAPEKRRLIHALLMLYHGDAERYLNYYGPPRTIRTVPYHWILQPSSGAARDESFKLEDLKGKMVFVGFSAAQQPEQDRVRDDYRTVFSQPSGLDISGVEIAATAFSNLLEDRTVRPLPLAGSLGLVFVWGALVGIVCWTLRPAAGAALSAVLAAVYLYVAHVQFTLAGLWLPLVIPLCLQAPLACVSAMLAKYRDVRREREAIKRAFGHFLPDSVVDRLARNVGPVTADNRLVQGACLATDVEQYTALAEKIEPERLSRLMNDYYAVLFQPVERHGGIVSDVVGDAMLAIWAAASSDRSLRAHACQAALDICAALTPFSQASGQALPTRIGLHSGEFMLGSIGAVHHYEYRAVGDIVNTANRIQGLNKHLGTRLLVSEAAVEGLEEFLVRPLGSFLLAGKSTPVRVRELLAPRKDADNRRLRLCDQFASALAAYDAQQWGTAADGFMEMLKEFPEDGPARLYLSICRRYAVNPPAAPWDPAVRIEGK